MTALSLVILSWNTEELLRTCLQSIFEGARSIDFQVVVVDNDSHDRSAAMVEESFPQVTLIRNERNEGYARGNNIGLKACQGDFLLLLNSDTEVKNDALEAMVRFLRENPDYGAVGAQLLNPDGTIQRACMRFPGILETVFFDTFIEALLPQNRVVKRYFMRDFDHAHARDVDQPPGACFMIRREIIDRIGLLDEDLWLFYNDVDYSKRIWEAGYKIRFFTGAQVVHHVGKSTSKYRDFGLEWHKNRVRYYRKHFGIRGTMATKCAVLLKGFEEIMKCLRSGSMLRSPEVKKIWDTVREVLRT